MALEENFSQKAVEESGFLRLKGSDLVYVRSTVDETKKFKYYNFILSCHCRSSDFGSLTLLKLDKYANLKRIQTSTIPLESFGAYDRIAFNDLNLAAVGLLLRETELRKPKLRKGKKRILILVEDWLDICDIPQCRFNGAKCIIEIISALGRELEISYRLRVLEPANGKTTYAMKMRSFLSQEPVVVRSFETDLAMAKVTELVEGTHFVAC